MDGSPTMIMIILNVKSPPYFIRAAGTFVMLHENGTRLCKRKRAIFDWFCKHFTGGRQGGTTLEMIHEGNSVFCRNRGVVFTDFGGILLVGVIWYSDNQDCPLPNTKDNTEIPRQ